MTGLVHFEYAPPRSWEQFEELCADLFEAMWRDPNLARHGRAGQVQNGVDIITSRGGITPVGLQCKKKSHWPETKLKYSEVLSEIEKADGFTPTLKEFYILTTASTDATLQKQIRELNISREENSKFSVQVLFWTDIVRKIALFSHVANKHFPLGTNANEFSPLLATWYTRKGKIELSNEEWSLSVRELAEDFYDWGSGHIIIRQRETDELIEKINNLEIDPLQENARQTRLELRQELRQMKERERHLQDVVRNIFTNEKLRFYIFDLDGNGAQEILKSIIESKFLLESTSRNPSKIRVYPSTPELLIGPRSPSSLASSDLTIHMPDDEYVKILNTENDFPKKYYGNKISKVVSELPDSVRRQFVIPALIGRLDRIMLEDKKTIDELDIAGYLDLNNWRYKH
ncbi:hypothetical protein [Rahnella contaminans]|uniref:hypothetical protein n=1 Tax=Rahnella contaminans TaxID=2703882 RepID=UPI003C30C313